MCKDIYIVLTMTGTCISRILNKFYEEEYVHVSIALDKELNEMYSFGRRSNIMPLIGGLVKEDINSKVFTEHVTKCEVLKITVKEQQYVYIKELISKCLKDYDKYRYNLIGLIPMYLNKRYERQTHFTCSQFVAFILEKSDVYKFKGNWSLAKPMDFEKLKNIDVTYKGLLKDYRKNLEEVNYV